MIFLSSVDPITAVNDYGWSESPAILAGKPETKALEEIALALEDAGIELQMLHAEAAPGQVSPFGLRLGTKFSQVLLYPCSTKSSQVHFLRWKHAMHWCSLVR